MSSESPATATAPAPTEHSTTSEPKIGYEFTTEQNNVIGGLGKKMKLVGLVLLIFGALNLITAFLAQLMFPQLDNERIPADVRDQLAQVGKRERWVATGFVSVVGIVFLCVGGWTRAAGGSFSQIAATSGKDTTHLMEGFQMMHKMYSLIATALIVGIFAYLILIIVKAVQT